MESLETDKWKEEEEEKRQAAAEDLAWPETAAENEGVTGDLYLVQPLLSRLLLSCLLLFFSYQPLVPDLKNVQVLAEKKNRENHSRF